MKKLHKILTVALTLFCLALTCAAFAACGEPAEEKDGTYTVTVLTPDGSPVQGVEIAFCDADTGLCGLPVTTDANGKVTYNGKPEVNYHVQINGGVPDGLSAAGYTEEDSECYTDDWEGSSYTITLKEAD